MGKKLQKKDTLHKQAHVDPDEEAARLVDDRIMKIHEAIYRGDDTRASTLDKRRSIGKNLFKPTAIAAMACNVTEHSTEKRHSTSSEGSQFDGDDAAQQQQRAEEANSDDATSQEDPFRLHYKFRNTGWLVRFMHSLSLGEEGTLREKELEKISELRAKYLRAEFVANDEATMGLTILRPKVFQYLIDLEHRIRRRRPSFIQLSTKGARDSIGFIRREVPGLKGSTLDLSSSDNQMADVTQEANYDNYWQMYRVSEQTKYMTRRGDLQGNSLQDTDENGGETAPAGDGLHNTSGPPPPESSPQGHAGPAEGPESAAVTLPKLTSSDEKMQPRNKVLSKLSRRNWPSEALTSQPPIMLQQQDRRIDTARSTLSREKMLSSQGGFDDTLALSKSRMMHVCEDHLSGDGREIENMPLGVRRKLKAKGLLGTQIINALEDFRRPATYGSAETNSSRLPGIAQRETGRPLIPSEEPEKPLARSRTAEVLETLLPGLDVSSWREFSEEAPRINYELEKIVKQQFKYPGCLAFFEAVRSRGLPPTPLPVLAAPLGVNDLVLSHKGLSDRELEAIVTGAVEIRSQPLKRLYLNGNSITDRGFLFLLDRLEEAEWLDSVEFIDLSDNIALGTDTIRSFGRLLQDDLVPKLVVLKLSGINITDYAYAILLEGLDNEIIEELDLSYTALGRWSNQGPICVGDMILRLQHLKVLDISGNHLNHMALDHIGFALAEVDVVTSLSCANNSVLLSHSLGTHFARSGYLGKAGLVALEECVGRKALDNCFPCMNILCTYLGSIASVEYVDLRNSQLNYQSAFVLADSLCIHPSIHTVLVSNNPLGADGIRALLRLMYLNPYPPDRKMYFVDVDRCEFSGVDDTPKGDGGNGDDSLDVGANYNFLDPTGSYRLHMENPYNRAVARQCLRRWQIIEDSISFPDTFYEIRHDGASLTSFELDEENVWQLPNAGMLTYTAVYRQKSPEAAVDPDTLNDDPTRTIRKRLSDDLFQRLMRCYTHCGQDSSRRPIIEALSKDFALEAEQVSILFNATVTSELKVFLLETFLDKILDPAHALSLLDYLAKITIFTQEASLPLGIAMPGKKKVSNKRLVRPADIKLYFIFSGSNPTGHYKLDLKTADHYMVAEHLLCTNRWDVEWCKAKGRPDVSQYGNYQCFRNEHMDGIPFKYGQDWSLPSSGTLEFDYISPHRAPKTAVPITAEAWLRVTQSIQDALSEGRLSPEVIMMCLRRVSHHFYVKCAQVDNLLVLFPISNHHVQLRRDIFIMLYNRIVDYVSIREHFCRPRLGFPAQFGPTCVSLLERRLGMLNLLNPLRADNSVFKCHFGTHEGRVLAQIVLRLKRAEDSRFINSRIGTSPDVTLPLEPPQDWYRCVPFEGFWEVTYVCDDSNAKMNVRKEIAVAYCAYEF
ncbi:NLR, CARD domain-containing protein 3 [Perkinsus olseni]|uniref:NLR, CARD domain-containing protein 3 n=1 Tax=Perkinsus olseni TaxID=32597 RepID=A0A7J6LFD0_PEROL|nr:NLR, CARD domain-containing protein 3 [Perkinsus olseni]